MGPHDETSQTTERLVGAKQATGPDVAAVPALDMLQADPEVVERRRPGRRVSVDPALIPLLRRTPDLDALLPVFDLEEERIADRAPSRGILLGIGVSALLWAGGIALIAWAVLR